MATREEYLDIADQALREGDEATAMAAMDEAEKLSSAAQTAAEKPGVIPTLGAGFVRGVEQVTGGALQRMAESRKARLDEEITILASGMQDGSIPVTNENLAKLDRMQSEAVKLTQDLAGAQEVEMSKRQEYAPYSEQRPIASTVGNIAGQMAAFPVPGIQARLPVQMAKGALEGGAIGYMQPTIEEEDAQSAATTGAAVGGAAPAVLRPVAQAAGAGYRALTGEIPVDARQAIDYASREGLPLMTSDVTPPQTFAGKSAQSLAEKIPVLGTGVARAEQQLAREGAVKSITEQYGVPSDEEIFNSLTRKADKISNAAGKRYREITSNMAGVEVVPSSTISTIDAQLARLNRPGAIKNERLTRILQSIKDDISSGAQDINLLRENRTRFREEIKGESMAINDTEQRIIDSVYNSMTYDITNAVKNTLGPGAAASMRQADAVWAREANEIKKTKLKNIFNKGQVKPEEASKMLFSNDRSEIRTLYSSLDTAGRKNARAAIINKAAERSDGSPDAFLREMKKLREQQSVFFRGREGADLNGLIKYLDYTREAGKASVLTPTGQSALQLGAPVAVMADIGTTGGAGTAGFAGYAILAKAYESPAIRDLMARMSSVQKGSTEFEKLAAKLESELNRIATVSTTAQ